jgi:hypothetical protein
VLGRLVPAELEALSACAQVWNDRHLRIEPIDASRIAPAIAALYTLDGLPVPPIVIVPSPGVLAFAGTLAAWAWGQRDLGRDPLGLPLPAPQPVIEIASPDIAEATRCATLAALAGPDVWPAGAGMPHPDRFEVGMSAYSEADLAVAEATDRDVHDDIESVSGDLLDLYYAINDQMRDEFGNSTPTPRMQMARDTWGEAVSRDLFPHGDDSTKALQGLGDWFRQRRDGNVAAHWEYRIAASRDALGLRLPAFEAYAHWEACAIHGGLRYLHPRFCLVSDFPASFAAKTLPRHTLGTGRNTYQWRDGWSV